MERWNFGGVEAPDVEMQRGPNVQGFRKPPKVATGARRPNNNTNRNSSSSTVVRDPQQTAAAAFIPPPISIPEIETFTLNRFLPGHNGMFASSGGSLFGNAASQPSSAPGTTTTAATGSIFGSAPSNAGNAASNATGPSLFGSTLGASTAPTSSAAAPFNLFANAGAASSAPTIPSINIQPASGNTPSGGGLFGNTSSASSAAPAAGNLFGSTNTNTSAPTGGLFGSSTTAQSAQPTSSLFGGIGNQQQPQQANAGLFGASTNNNASTTNPGFKPLFSTLGGTGPQQQQQTQQLLQQQHTVPGVRIDINNVKPTTRFHDLHESLQQEIIAADEFIQSQIESITKCEVFIPAHGVSLTSIAPDVKFVRNKLDTLSQALSGDAGEINAVKGTLVQDIEDCQKEFKAVEHLKLPAQWQYNQQWASTGAGSDGDNVFAATDMVPYFDRHTTEMDTRLNKYKSQLAEIEAHLRTVEGSAVEQMHKVMQRQASGDQERGQIAELASAMHVFEEAVLRVAGKVGETREGVIDVTLGRMYPNGSRR